MNGRKGGWVGGPALRHTLRCFDSSSPELQPPALACIRLPWLRCCCEGVVGWRRWRPWRTGSLPARTSRRVPSQLAMAAAAQGRRGLPERHHLERGPGGPGRPPGSRGNQHPAWRLPCWPLLRLRKGKAGGGAGGQGEKRAGLCVLACSLGLGGDRLAQFGHGLRGLGRWCALGRGRDVLFLIVVIVIVVFLL